MIDTNTLDMVSYIPWYRGYLHPPVICTVNSLVSSIAVTALVNCSLPSIRCVTAGKSLRGDLGDISSLNCPHFSYCGGEISQHIGQLMSEEEWRFHWIYLIYPPLSPQIIYLCTMRYQNGPIQWDPRRYRCVMVIFHFTNREKYLIAQQSIYERTHTSSIQMAKRPWP